MNVGFIINSRVPQLAALRRGMPAWSLVTGWDDAASPMSFMRFRWIARELTRRQRGRFEIYKPLARYDAVMFVKSMGVDCLALAEHLRAGGSGVGFDANVDYYTDRPATAAGALGSMVAGQKADAIAMTRFADGVAASSRHLATICSEFSRRPAVWIPDNVSDELIPHPFTPWAPGRPLNLWWSGMAAKAADFLAIAPVLRKFGSRVKLQLVTQKQGFSERLPLGVRDAVLALLAEIPHEIHEFRSIGDLLQRYAQGGLIVSPRFLDTPYNLGHSEWKITLGMAAGLPALCSPVPSYEDVRERCVGDGIRVVQSNAGWEESIESVFSGQWEIAAAAEAARSVVRGHYATSVVADRVDRFLESLCHPA